MRGGLPFTPRDGFPGEPSNHRPPLNLPVNPDVGFVGKLDLSILFPDGQAFTDCEVKEADIYQPWYSARRIVGQSLLGISGSPSARICLLASQEAYVLIWRLFVGLDPETGLGIFEYFEFPGLGIWKSLAGENEQARDEFLEVLARIIWVGNIPIKHRIAIEERPFVPGRHSLKMSEAKSSQTSKTGEIAICKDQKTVSKSTERRVKSRALQTMDTDMSEMASSSSDLDNQIPEWEYFFVRLKDGSLLKLGALNMTTVSEKGIKLIAEADRYAKTKIEKIATVKFLTRNKNI